jgi:hypothetical protein
VGPFYLTPRFRIGTLGLDTNVFYTATDRRTDFTASGGPGLEVVLPLPSDFRLSASGEGDYLYFLRTPSQRKLNGSGRGLLSWKGARTEFEAQETYGSSYGRPSFEVDRRVNRTVEATRADLRRRLFGRTSMLLSADRGVDRVPEGEVFRGADLHRTLSSRHYGGRGQVSYAVTVKTSLAVEAGRQASRFPFLPERDGDVDRISGGIQTSSTALISGRLMVGRERFRLKRDASSRYLTSADVDLTWHVSPRTHIGGSYGRSLSYSAFQTTGPTPTLLTQTYGAHIEKELVGTRLRLTMQGTASHFVSDGAVVVELADGTQETKPRDDTFFMANVGLDYLFWSRIRIGATAGYAERRSTFSDFGIKGLLVGATASYNP